MSYLLDLSKGYLRVPRWLFDPQHPFSPQRARKKQPVSQREALLDLLALVIWKVGGCGDIDRGEVRTSVSFLAKRWTWSESGVRRFLRRLEKDGTILWYPGTGNETGVIRFPTYGAINPPPPGKSKKGGGAESSNGAPSWRPPAVPSPSLNSAKVPDRVEPQPGPLTTAPLVVVERTQENQEVTASYQEGLLGGRPAETRGAQKKKEDHPPLITDTDPGEARAVAEGESGDSLQVPPKKSGRAESCKMSAAHNPANGYGVVPLSGDGSPSPEHDLLPAGDASHDQLELNDDDYLRDEREGMALF
jgi:hypothetical protein